jgi:hypothetical protein
MNKHIRNIEEMAIDRAECSMACLPFKRAFYEAIDKSSMSSEDLCKKEDWADFVFIAFGPERAEEHFIWMIKLGILRREVDGQGLTNRVRLTPMGRQIISKSKGEIKRGGPRERMRETFLRHQNRL